MEKAEEPKYFQTWYVEYVRLRRYLNTYKRYPSRSDHDLYIWVLAVRLYYKEGKLTTKMIDFMNNLENWDWEYLTDWEINYEKYSLFVENTGFHPEFSKSAGTKSQENGLKKWADRSRKDYTENKLTAKQKKLLEKLPNWTWYSISGWDHKYEKLLRFIRRYDRYPEYIEMITPNFEKHLQKWVEVQRTDRGKGVLSKLFQDKLQELPNWRWVASFRLSNSLEIIKCAAAYGDLSLSLDKRQGTDTCTEINQWYENTLRCYRNKLLTSKEIATLRIFVSEVDFEEAWNDNVVLFQIFLKMYKRLPSKKHNPEKNERHLIDWISQMEIYISKGVLSQDKLRFYNDFIVSSFPKKLNVTNMIS